MANLPAKRTKALIVASDLWRWDGTIARAPYAVIGTGLFGIKYGIDASIAHFVFHRAWPIWAYLLPGQTLDVMALSKEDKSFFFCILVLALPFIWTGVVLTMRRLRDIGMPVYWVKLFFMPFVNCVMFFLLCTLPSQSENVNDLRRRSTDPLLEDVALRSSEILAKETGRDVATTSGAMPTPFGKDKESRLADANYALVSTVPVAIVLMWFGVFVLQNYGWGLFVGIPFVLGMTSAYMFGKNRQRTMRECIAIASIATLGMGLGIFIFAWEGAACIVMAAPIAFTLAIMGATLGYHMQKRKIGLLEQKFTMIGLLLIMPLLMGCEYSARPEAPMLGVVSIVDIDATPEQVWNNVIAFPELPPPTEPIFKLGIAYPIGATISGAGPGAVRKCRFSTGAFIEPIKVWDAPRLLKFGVISQPPTMREFSWLREIQPAHLHGYLNVQSGQFRLLPMTVGTKSFTRLEGTTWYQNKMWPNSYWRLWSDRIIHGIHMRVLKHIKTQSEKSS